MSIQSYTIIVVAFIIYVHIFLVLDSINKGKIWTGTRNLWSNFVTWFNIKLIRQLNVFKYNKIFLLKAWLSHFQEKFVPRTNNLYLKLKSIFNIQSLSLGKNSTKRDSVRSDHLNLGLSLYYFVKCWYSKHISVKKMISFC